jgi:hypothetical protein
VSVLNAKKIIGIFVDAKKVICINANAFLNDKSFRRKALNPLCGKTNDFLNKNISSFSFQITTLQVPRKIDKTSSPPLPEPFETVTEAVEDAISTIGAEISELDKISFDEIMINVHGSDDLPYKLDVE